MSHGCGRQTLNDKINMNTETDDGNGKGQQTLAPAGLLAAPVRRHPDCAESGCQTCLDDHQALADFIESKIGYSRDWLGEYRAYLDAKHIPAEVNGWASRQAFDEKNVSAFIEDWCS